MKKNLQALIVVLLLLITAGNSSFAQCTCPVGCSSLIDITIPFSFDGAGEYCFRTKCLGTYINAWNLEKLQINGIDQIIGYINTSILPPTGDGYYYIYYKSTVAWAHLEIGGTCSGTTTAPTTEPFNTSDPTISPDETSGPTDAPTATPAPTVTFVPSILPTTTPNTTDAPTAEPTATASIPIPTVAYHVYNSNNVCIVEPEVEILPYTFHHNMAVETSIAGYTGTGYVRSTLLPSYYEIPIRFPSNMVVKGRFYDTATSSWIFKDIIPGLLPSGNLWADFRFSSVDIILDRIIIFTGGTADSVWQDLTLTPLTVNDYLSDIIFTITVN